MPNESGRPEESRAGSDALADLRTYTHALTKAIIDHPNPSLERDEAQWRLEELVEELAKTPPSAPRVKSRWIRLTPLLTALRPDLPIPWLTDLINEAL